MGMMVVLNDSPCPGCGLPVERRAWPDSVVWAYRCYNCKGVHLVKFLPGSGNSIIKTLTAGDELVGVQDDDPGWRIGRELNPGDHGWDQNQGFGEYPNHSDTGAIG